MMSDLTLQDALEQYPDECMEVQGPAWLEITESSRELIGACVFWLAGKVSTPEVSGAAFERGEIRSEWVGPRAHQTLRCTWPTAPLRFYLEEVRAHICEEVQNE